MPDVYACGIERLRSETVQKTRYDSHSTGHCCRVDSRSGGNPGSDVDADSYSDSRSHSCPNSSGDADSPSDAHSRTDPCGDTGTDAHSCTVQSSASYKEPNR